MSELIGLVNERYYILEQIGHGGMTTVYKALDLQSDHEVALKVLAPYLVKDPKFKARFEREVEVLRALDHPNIVPILDFGEYLESPYIVMPYFASGTLGDRLQHGPLTPREGARLMDDIASALSYAHDKGIIHRDIKPSNILIDDDGNAFLSDFGLAYIHDQSQSLTGSAVIGTPAYMSPEQCGSGSIGTYSDQYSLAIVLYQLTTGFLPFEADTPIGVALQHVNAPLPRPRDLNPNLPEPIEWVLIKALEKDPTRRYPSVTSFNEAFKRAMKISMGSSQRDGWAAHLYQVTQVLEKVRFRSTSAVMRLRTMRRSVLFGGLLLLFGIPLAAYALYGSTSATPTVDLEATITALYIENLESGNITLSPGQIDAAVTETLGVLLFQASQTATALTPLPTPTFEPTGTLTPFGTASITPTATVGGFIPRPSATRTESSSTSAPPPPSSTLTPTPVSTPTSMFTATRTLTVAPSPTLAPTLTYTPKPINPKACNPNPDNPNYCTPTPNP